MRKFCFIPIETLILIFKSEGSVKSPVYCSIYIWNVFVLLTLVFLLAFDGNSSSFLVKCMFAIVFATCK